MPLKLRTEELEWKLVDDEIVALDVRKSRYLSIDGSGVMLWQALAAGTNRDQLVTALVDRYGIEETRAALDTDTFLSDLSKHGLLAA
jgi:hypothetical protein